MHAIRDIAREQHVDVLEGRLRGVTSDSWMPQLLFLAPVWTEDPADETAVRRLLAAVDEEPHTAPVAVVMLSTGPQAAGTSVAAGLHLDVDEQGTLRIAELDVTATAQRLPANQAADLALYLAALRDSSADVPMPAAAADDDDAQTFTDRAGAVLPEHTLPRPQTRTAPAARIALASAASTSPMLAADVPPASSLLPKPTAVYIAATAVTEDDVEALAPVVKPEVGAALLAKFPHLDEDLAAWHDPAGERATLRLLGDVTLTAFGSPPDSSDALVTEAIAYLALHRRGVTGDQFAAEMWPASQLHDQSVQPEEPAAPGADAAGHQPAHRRPVSAARPQLRAAVRHRRVPGPRPARGLGAVHRLTHQGRGAPGARRGRPERSRRRAGPGQRPAAEQATQVRVELAGQRRRQRRRAL